MQKKGLVDLTHRIDKSDGRQLNIDYDKSPYCGDVQRSEYVGIDNQAYLNTKIYKN